MTEKEIKEIIEQLTPPARAFLLQVIADAQKVIEQRNELLAALEDTIAMARSLSDTQNEYIERAVNDFIAGDISDLIASVKSAVVSVAISETQEPK